MSAAGSGGRRWLVALAGAGLLLALGSALTVSRLEESDDFCAACHTAPEVEYHHRARAALAAGEGGQDLASVHYNLIETEAKCIDCHRGTGGLVHRAVTLTLGARDALIFVAGQADPTLEKTTIEVPFLLDAACVKCHTDTLLVAGFENHFHNKLPEAYAAWKAGGQLAAPPDAPNVDTSALKAYDTSVQCVDCHPAHVTVDGAELTQYLDVVNTVYPACVACHEQVGHGPLELVRP